MTETTTGFDYDEANPAFSFNYKSPNEYSEADLNEMFRAYNESGNDFDRNFISLMVGTADSPLDCQIITCRRGDTASLKEEWESIRDFYLQDAEELVQGGARDIGPVEQGFFVVAEDNNLLDKPWKKPGWEDNPIQDVWNFFWNCWEDEKRKQVWDQFKKDYQTVYNQVATAVIEPPPEGQRYFYHDRID